jgi:hypothetical protein
MKHFLIPTLALFLAGCATSGAHMDQDKLASLKPGITTIAETENILGKPQSVLRHADGSTTLGYDEDDPAHAFIAALSDRNAPGILG